MEAGAGGELFFVDAAADGPVGVDEGLGGGAFGFRRSLADDGAAVGVAGLVLLLGEEWGWCGGWHFGPAGRV